MGLGLCACCSVGLTKALALVGCPVHEDLRGDDGTEGQKHLHEFIVSKLLWQVVDEQVTTLWTWLQRCSESLIEKERNSSEFVFFRPTYQPK